MNNLAPIFIALEREVGVETYLRRVVSLSKTLYSPKVLVIPRKRWHRPDMTEKLLTETLNFSTNKQTNKNFLSTCRSIRTVLLLEDRESRTNNHCFLCLLSRDPYSRILQLSS